jgi:hypothetical protein
MISAGHQQNACDRDTQRDIGIEAIGDGPVALGFVHRIPDPDLLHIDLILLPVPFLQAQ